MEYEREVERYLKDRIEAEGGLCWKFTSPGTQGVPDRWCVLKGMQFFVELKRAHGRLSKVQKFQIDQLQERGVTVYVIRSKTDVDDLIYDLTHYRYFFSEGGQ
ncbi:VRR-NUC domain-containing protein [uncultured Dubosiella sp.]|uniref:VRR-NUC domain-containing protein n=1 Tax=uncultured Dubosiella sp. TaxID=1937011 RepID=UPI00272FFD20|nr:VRR-NUC domain-containing protein [uncultured Dubosiella sp.]